MKNIVILLGAAGTAGLLAAMFRHQCDPERRHAMRLEFDASELL